MVYSVEIHNKNGKIFILQEAECNQSKYNMRIKLFKSSIPGGSDEDTIIINLGRETIIDIPFTLRNTDGDASKGTHSSTVNTINQKISYLLHYFITKGLEDLYTININTDTGAISDYKCMLEGFEFNPSADKPNILNGSFSFAVGGGLQQ